MICDVRFDLSDHDRGPAITTLHTSLERDLSTCDELAVHDGSSPTGGGRHPLPATQQFAEVLERNGISPSSFVVAYDDAGGAVAARLWWMLRSIEHQRAAVLDGGYPRGFQPANMLKLILLQSTTQRMKFLLIGQGSSPLTRLSPPSTAAEPSSTLGRRPDIEAIPNRSTRRLAIFLVHSTSSTAAISARTGFTVRLPIFKSV